MNEAWLAVGMRKPRQGLVGEIVAPIVEVGRLPRVSPPESSLCPWRARADRLWLRRPPRSAPRPSLRYRREGSFPRVPTRGASQCAGGAATLGKVAMAAADTYEIAASPGVVACCVIDPRRVSRVSAREPRRRKRRPARGCTRARTIGWTDARRRCPTLRFASSCSVSQTATDPFPLGYGEPADTTATCTIELADVGADTARLVNTCSYPSQVPNSNPTDCVLFPRDGFIVIDPEPPPGRPVPERSVHARRGSVPMFTARRAPSQRPDPGSDRSCRGRHAIARPAARLDRHRDLQRRRPISAIAVASGETVTCTIGYELPDTLSVKASMNAATAVRDRVTITVIVINRGPGAAGPMNVCVRRPAASTRLRATRGARRRNGSVCWRRTSVAPRKRLRRRVTVRIERTSAGRSVARVRVRSKGHRLITRRASIRVRALPPDPCATLSQNATASC